MLIENVLFFVCCISKNSYLSRPILHLLQLSSPYSSDVWALIELSLGIIPNKHVNKNDAIGQNDFNSITDTFFINISYVCIKSSLCELQLNIFHEENSGKRNIDYNKLILFKLWSGIIKSFFLEISQLPELWSP